jgi:hypothetical protein
MKYWTCGHASKTFNVYEHLPVGIADTRVMMSLQRWECESREQTHNLSSTILSDSAIIQQRIQDIHLRMALKSLEFVVKGTVHGVGFRQFVRDIARADGLVGWVKNDPVCFVLLLSQDMTLSYIRRGMLLE